jgi:Fe-S oxidoreductase
LQEFLIRLPAYFKQGKALKGKPSDNEHRPIKTVGESFILPYAIFPLNTMQVALMIPCYVDLFYPEVGVATLELLEKLKEDVHRRRRAKRVVLSV